MSKEVKNIDVKINTELENLNELQKKVEKSVEKLKKLFKKHKTTEE